ncbi:MAG TPA: mannose-1-phosphate guanylyltransferase [Pirellulales bacterium]|nr:mannose-1-phosphate guanylyltransferase [Pirellulales bacterium]
MLHAIIMAGGAGSRFWPESRELRPKQLLTLLGDRSMLQATVDRLEGLVPPERVVIATRANLVDAIAEQLPRLPREAILAEPCQRDTAACIGLAALWVARHDPAATMVVLPADHVIAPTRTFQQAIEYAATLIDQHPRRIATFGIKPTYPAESFGYIERGEPIAAGADAPPTFHAKRFREKPRADVARDYLAAGTFYWNSGIFLWRAATIIDALETHAPQMAEHLHRIAQAFGQPEYPQVLEREFSAIQGVSIDYAVMEHARDVVVVEAPFAWDDVGSWQAIARLQGQDGAGNTVVGKHLGLRTAGSIVRTSDEHLIVTVGLNNCLVVHTPEATLVADKACEEQVREIVKLLRERGWTESL